MDDEEDDEDEDVPNEEMIERMEDRLDAAQSEQKNLFLIIFQVAPILKHIYIYNKLTFQPPLSCLSYWIL